VRGTQFNSFKEFKMTKPKPQKQIFLTYAHSDKKAVRQLYYRMARKHLKVWLDEKELSPGQTWKHEIRQAILSSNIVLVCLSRQFNKQGGYRHEELKIALEKASSLSEREIFIIPARLEKCEVPELLRRWQYVNLFEAEGFIKLLRVLKEFDYPPG
jgi:TIR domain-containing protein